ncbi:hypothetical protein [Mesorhizobium sp. M0244]|uniref:hypothetical protein n=1 Tax=Mesorhizobium sp. M0244 TaxID=2956926 RepID=UPI003337289A
MITSAQALQLIHHLKEIAEALSVMSGGFISAPPATATVPTSPWDSPNVPAGYDTVLGHLNKTHPEIISLMDEPVSGTQRDGYWCTHQASRRQLGVVKVDAPPSMVEMGIATVNAYPIELLTERFG